MKKNLLATVVLFLVSVSTEYSFADGQQGKVTKTVTHQIVTTRRTAATGSSQHHPHEKAPGSNHTNPNGASMHHATETKHEHTVTTVVEVTNNSKTVNKDRTNPAQPSSLEFHERDLLHKLTAKARGGEKLSSPDREKLYELTHRSEGEEAAKKVIQAYHQNRLGSKSSAEKSKEQKTPNDQDDHLTNEITKAQKNKSDTQVVTPPLTAAKTGPDAKEKKNPLTLEGKEEDKKSVSQGAIQTTSAAGLPAGEGAALAIKGISEGAKLGATAARQASKAVVPGVEKAAERSGSLVGRGIVSAGKVAARAAYELTHRSEGEAAAKKAIQDYHQNRLKSKSSAEETHKQNTQDVQEVHLTNRITKAQKNKSDTQVVTPPLTAAKTGPDSEEKKNPLTLEDKEEGKKSTSRGANHAASAVGLPAGEGAALAIKGISEGAKLGATAARQASKAVVPGVEKAAERSGSLVGRGIVSAGKVAARAAKVSAKAAYRGAKVAAPVIGKGLYLGAKGGATLGAAAVTGTGLAIYHGAKATAKFVGGVAKGASRALKDGGNQKSNYSSSIVPYAGGPASGGYPSFSGASSSSAIIPYQGSTSQSGIGASGSQNNPPRSISSGASGSSSSSNDWQKLGLSAAPSSATEVKAAFRKAALSNHSDKGGSGDMDSLRSARDRLLERIEQSQ